MQGSFNRYVLWNVIYPQSRPRTLTKTCGDAKSAYTPLDWACRTALCSIVHVGQLCGFKRNWSTGYQTFKLGLNRLRLQHSLHSPQKQAFGAQCAHPKILQVNASCLHSRRLAGWALTFVLCSLFKYITVRPSLVCPKLAARTCMHEGQYQHRPSLKIANDSGSQSECYKESISRAVYQNVLLVLHKSS